MHRHWPASLALYLFCIPAVSAQIIDRPLSSFLYGRNGLRLDSASIYGGFYSLSSPGSDISLPQAFNVGNQSLMAGTANIQWTRAGERSHINLVYSPSYISYIGEQRSDSWNHTIGFSAGTRLGGKWSLSAGWGATYSDMDQLLFAPTSLGRAAALPTDVGDLATALLQNPFTNQQIAALLGGSAIADSPIRALFFGNRMLNVSTNAVLSYSYSSRTTLSISAGGSRSQPIATSKSNIQNTLLENRSLGNATSANLSLTLSHALTPRTQIGVNAEANRVFSNVQDAYRTSVSAFIGRRMGIHWLAQANGGIGNVTPIRQVYELPTGVQYRGGGGIAFITRSQTFLGSLVRNFGDQFGTGASSTLDISGAWRWSNQRRSWSVYANVSDQRFFGTSTSIRGWQAVTGMSRMLGSHLSSSIEYAYLRYDTRSNIIKHIGQNGVRVSLTWVPLLR